MLTKLGWVTPLIFWTDSILIHKVQFLFHSIKCQLVKDQF